MVVSLAPRNNSASELRRRIVDAAWKLGNEAGDDALTIRNIAAQVGISPALLYTYFEGKGALMREMRAMAAPQLEAQLGGAIDRDDAPMESLFRLCVAYVEFAREHRWLYTMVARGFESGDAANHSTDAFIARATELLRARGDDSSEDPVTRALQLRVALAGLAETQAEASQRPLSADQRSFVESYVRMLMRGV
ncbi:MAG TPA: TetR/AcrR family transcriptional regulator [Nannocystaceae bacterium]|nr:TetR/AcrR family transcriptional regulator [Nannocystaceae bacterium]